MRNYGYDFDKQNGTSPLDDRLKYSTPRKNYNLCPNTAFLSYRISLGKDFAPLGNIYGGLSANTKQTRPGDLIPFLFFVNLCFLYKFVK